MENAGKYEMRNWRKTCSSATLPTGNLTQIGRISILELCGDGPATERVQQTALCDCSGQSVFNKLQCVTAVDTVSSQNALCNSTVNSACLSNCSVWCITGRYRHIYPLQVTPVPAIPNNTTNRSLLLALHPLMILSGYPPHVTHRQATLDDSERVLTTSNTASRQADSAMLSGHNCVIHYIL